MPDWTKSMKQTYEYYTVDPTTMKDKKRLFNITGCTIERDVENDTLGSGTIDFVETIGEDYIRVYLVTDQNGVVEKHPLGTLMVQTPSSDFDGKVRKATADAYTPLIELKEKMPPIGYTIKKGSNIIEKVCEILTPDVVSAPVIKTTGIITDIPLAENFVADPADTWLGFLKDLLEPTKYKFMLDDYGRIGFTPERDVEAMTPTWTYDDGNSSILNAELSMTHDLYDVPNVVEVVYSNKNSEANSPNPSFKVIIKNEDPNSPVSTVSRKREVWHRDTNPALQGTPTYEMVEDYAKKLLKEMSTVEYTLSYTHGYCGTRLGDCVRLNYSRAGITNVKAKIISQNIKCKPGCPVSEKAVFTTTLWG
jgi:hypothetical protein